MGYFSNGTEGMQYESEYCEECVHYKDCAVWEAHMLRNYDESNNKDSILHILIPCSEDGLFNKRCRMFIPKGGANGKV
jgi:hypothetical protein